jgi:hypothetical protein
MVLSWMIQHEYDAVDASGDDDVDPGLEVVSTECTCGPWIQRESLSSFQNGT